MVPPPSESLETVGFSYFSKGDGGRKVLTHLPRIIKNRWIVLVFEGGGGECFLTSQTFPFWGFPLRNTSGRPWREKDKNMWGKEGTKTLQNTV